MEKSSASKPTQPPKKRVKPPQHGSPEQLDTLRRGFVQGASWALPESGGEPVLIGVTFFSPQVIQAARQAAGMDLAMSEQTAGSPAGMWDETPEMIRLRELAADPKTSGEAAEHYERQYKKLLAAEISYRSS